jgi:hypothetical protein
VPINLRPVAALGAALLLAACAPSTGTYKDELIAADKAFSARSAREGARAAYLATLSSDAKLLAQYRTGADGVKDTFMQLPDNAKLTWEAAYVDASSLGELGYTWGRYTLVLPTVRSRGQPFTQRGNYVFIWKRDRFNTWKVVFEGRTPDTH